MIDADQTSEVLSGSESDCIAVSPPEIQERGPDFQTDAKLEMSVAEYQARPKFVPRDQKQDATGPLLLQRKTTLTKDQVSKALKKDGGAAAQAHEHNTLLDCCLCKNIMIDPVECSKCRKGFCRKCIDGYIDQLVTGEYDICCPNCGAEDLQLAEPHPLLLRQLSKLRGACEYADKGCDAVVNYADLEEHLKVCGYATIKCTFFGCEKEMLQKDYAEHSETCEFREIRCDKCGMIKKKGQECDCIKNMAANYEKLAEKLTFVSQKLDLELERAERNRLANDKGTQLVRHELMLPGLSQIKFEAREGWHQTLSQPVAGLPPFTRALIVRFGLTDLNVRREYGSLVLYQAGSQARIDLTNFFIVGHAPLPPFGQSSEIIMPWDENLDQTLIVEFQISPTMPTPQPYDPYYNAHNAHQNPFGGYPHYAHGPPPHMPPASHANPHAYAFISIAGFQHKC